MRKICAWCGKPLGDVGDPRPVSRVITHGICEDCRNAMLTTLSIPLGEYLESLPEPVLLVDADARVLEANSAARCQTHVGSDMPPGTSIGHVFECTHARETGGCGRALHCSGCTIRRAVTDTYETGEAHQRVPATLMVSSDGPPSRVRLYVTTEKAGDRVLLRVDEAPDPD